MALTMSAGGRMSRTSTRVILTPQASVAWSTTVEQPGVDLVALGQGLVEVHRAHHGAQVGGRELHDGGVEVGDLIGGLGGVEHLEEDDSVDRDHRIVLGDDLLAGDVEHLLHHVHLAADPVEEGHVEIEPRAATVVKRPKCSIV
jgi:hypothetical protein